MFLAFASSGCEEDAATPSGTDATTETPEDTGVESDSGAGADTGDIDSSMPVDLGSSRDGGQVDLSAQLVILTGSVPSARRDVDYQAMVVASGGGTTYTWTVASGSLPDGLTLTTGTPAATLTGRPLTARTFDFVLRVRDEASAEASAAFRIVVGEGSSGPPMLSGGALPDACLGVPYMTELTATATGALVWTVVSGTLPPGLTLDAIGQPNGLLRGTPTMAGRFSFSARVEDPVRQTAMAQYDVAVLDDCGRIVDIVAMALPAADTNVAYEVQLRARGGAGSYVWSVSTGSLPPGLALEPGGRIVGIPRTPGSYSFRVEARDSTGSFDRESFTIVVGA